MKRLYAVVCVALICMPMLAGCLRFQQETGPDEELIETFGVPAESLFEPQTSLTEATECVPDKPPETVDAETDPPEKDAFVRVCEYIPGLVVELKYATEDNFTGQVVYDFSDAYLRYGTVCKLVMVQQELEAMGLGLKLWDGFRPPSAQFKLWEICPDPTYVSDPNKGCSSHSRGDTVDITLVDAHGNELVMPTGFDDFSLLADRDYSDCTDEAAQNAQLLEQLMKKYGFTGYAGEWWHYADNDDYPVETDFLSQ